MVLKNFLRGYQYRLLKGDDGMKYSTALRDEVRSRIELVESADLVVGIPCYNNQATIGHVVKQVSQGLHQYYRDRKCVIVVSDGGSVDDSREEARAVEVSPFQEIIVTIYRGVPGKGSALRAVLELARFLKAEACVVVDSDLRSISAQWIRNLLSPILYNDYQFVAPHYRRFKLDGTITNNIVYNMTRALYGKKVRQPIGGDFAFSRDVVSEIYDQDVWDTEVGRFGIDIWLTTMAIVKGFKICQTRLGAKIHDVKDPGASLGPMFRQVVSTLFSLAEEYRNYWWDIQGSDEVPVVGDEIETEPESFPINIETLVESFRNGYRQFGALWKNILSEESWQEVQELAEKSDGFQMDDHKWAHILYDAASTYHCWPMNRFKLVELLTPLYYARVASFAKIVENMSDEDAEQVVEKQAMCFEDEKEYLLKRWKIADEMIGSGDFCGQPG
jgi:glycosyltransferase involved in cell wall biosynthesis